jgi:hypothetical protein
MALAFGGSTIAPAANPAVGVRISHTEFDDAVTVAVNAVADGAEYCVTILSAVVVTDCTYKAKL